VIRRLVGALALVAIGSFVPVAAAPAQAAGWYDGPCTDNVDITVVIDFRELGGGVNVRCASGPVSTGLDALDKAGVSWESARRFPGLVCRIAGKPGPEAEACGNAPPLSAYWSYWAAPRGGQWCYSTVGAGNRTPPPGTIEGWSFALNRTSVDTPPPGYDPPPPIDGQPPNQLRGSDCGTPSNAPAPATTTAPVAPAAPTTVSAPPVPTTPPPATDAVGEVPIATAATIAPTAGTAGSSSTTSAVSSTSTSVGRSSTTSSTDRVSGSVVSAEAAGTSSQGSSESTALGTVDLGDDGRDEGGLGAATVIGAVLAVGLIGAGTWAARRRRIAP
jgi:hypothetical protein